MRTHLACILGLGLGLVACGTDSESGPIPEDPPEPRATWYQDVAPILANHCMSCHSDGGIAPFTLTDYDSAREVSEMMLINVDKGVMPPFDAREEADCTPRHGWKDDARLTAAEKATLHAWVEDGHALGTVAEIPAAPSTALSGITKTLKPVMPFTTEGTRDQFICYVLDPGNTELKWLTGLQVRPGNDLVVHHAVITELQPSPETTALVTQRGIGIPFDCSTQQTPGFVVNIWTPGNQPLQTPSELAVPIVANAKLVMQIHYHPAGVVNDPDATEIDLRFSTVWPRKMYFVAAVGNESAAPNLEPDPITGAVEFAIPANEANHAEKMSRTITDLGGLTNVRIFSVNPHMHLIGTHISSRIERATTTAGEPANECLANGNWNFDWQRTYVYDAPIDQLPTVKVGDTLKVDCRWDNTLANPFVQRMLHDAGLGAQPIKVTLGEQTTNEMCLEIFGLAVDAPAEPVGRVMPDVKIPTIATGVKIR